MKKVLNLSTGRVQEFSDNTAATLVKTGKFAYVSEEAPKWVPVKSSNLNSVWYDMSTKELRIRFGQPAINSEYSYSNVPKTIYDNLLKADSKGKYFYANILDKYDYKRIK